MQVGEEGRVGPKQLDLLRLWLLDAEDQVGLGPHVLDRDDARPLRLVVGIADRAALAGASLDQHLVPMLAELPGADGGQRDPVLVRLDLGWNSDLHEQPPAAASPPDMPVSVLKHLTTHPAPPLPPSPPGILGAPARRTGPPGPRSSPAASPRARRSHRAPAASPRPTPASPWKPRRRRSPPPPSARSRPGPARRARRRSPRRGAPTPSPPTAAGPPSPCAPPPRRSPWSARGGSRAARASARAGNSPGGSRSSFRT